MRRQQNSMQEGGQAVMDGTLPLALTEEECQNRCHSDERCKVCLTPVFTILCQLTNSEPHP